MREIKFRGKRVNNGERVYGSLRVEDSSAFILSDDYTIQIEIPNTPALDCGVEDGGWQKNGYTAAHYGWNECIDRYADALPVWDEVIPESVSQYTGLKDKNGKEIWEGDVCRVIANTRVPQDPFAVIWNNEYAQWFWKDLKGEDEFWKSIAERSEVIGNIHDNPDLLKGTEP